MILLLDLGNSALKWAFYHDRAFSLRGRISHQDLTVSDLEAKWSTLPHPDAVVISSVTGASTLALVEQMVGKLWNRKPHRLATQAECCGLRNAYPRFQDLGIDRWAAMIAARECCRGAISVIDCGTAVTIDLIDGDGRHQGGIILPGLASMREALLQNTQLSMNEQEQAGTLSLADNTRDAIVNGALTACVAAIDRVVQQAASRLGQQPECVITGGDSESVRALLQAPCHYEPDLVFTGMFSMYQHDLGEHAGGSSK